MPKSLGSTESGVVARVDFFSQDKVRGFEKQAPGRLTIRWSVLGPVRNPDVRHRRYPQFPSKIFTNLAAGDAVFHPKFADANIAMRESKSIGGFWMRKTGRVEINAVPLRLRPIFPRREVTRLDGIAPTFLSASR